MNRDDIIRMGNEANLPICHLTHPKALARFAALVAAAAREECAKVCDEMRHTDRDGVIAAIRARGQK